MSIHLHTHSRLHHSLHLADGSTWQLRYLQHWRQALIHGAIAAELRPVPAGWYLQPAGARQQVWGLVMPQHRCSFFIALHAPRLHFTLQRQPGCSSRFVLTDSRQEEFLSIQATLHWQHQAFHFQLHTTHQNMLQQQPLLALLAVHCANAGMNLLNGLDAST